MRRLAGVTAGILLLLAGQIAFAVAIRGLVPHRDLLPPVPSSRTVQAESFGDRQFLFRIASLDLQNAGDTGGRIVPVKNYDFNVVLGWLRTLQQLDSRSIIPIELADGFFGQSQNLDYVRPIVGFMQENVALYPEKRWRYLYDAIYLAQSRLKDNRLALKVAQQLATYDFPDVPVMAAMAPVFIFEAQGNFDDARVAVEETRQRYAGRITPDDEALIAKHLDFIIRSQRPVNR